MSAGSQNLGQPTRFLNNDGYIIKSDQIPGVLPSTPYIPQTPLENLRDSLADFGGELLNNLQAISPAEGALVGAVGMH